MVISMESLFSDLLHFREYADAGWVRLEGRRIQWTEDPQADAFLSNYPPTRGRCIGSVPLKYYRRRCFIRLSDWMHADD